MLPVGEAMEQGLRDCCRSIRIGKILIQSDEDTHEAKVYYAKFPPDVNKRKVLLMYPIMSEWLSVYPGVGSQSLVGQCSVFISSTMLASHSETLQFQ